MPRCECVIRLTVSPLPFVIVAPAPTRSTIAVGGRWEDGKSLRDDDDDNERRQRALEALMNITTMDDGLRVTSVRTFVYNIARGASHEYIPPPPFEKRTRINATINRLSTLPPCHLAPVFIEPTPSPHQFRHPVASFTSVDEWV